MLTLKLIPVCSLLWIVQLGPVCSLLLIIQVGPDPNANPKPYTCMFTVVDHTGRT